MTVLLTLIYRVGKTIDRACHRAENWYWRRVEVAGLWLLTRHAKHMCVRSDALHKAPIVRNPQPARE